MKQCKHCGIPYHRSKGRGEFCCAGCEHVYGMIREGGFEDYYSKQDRAGKPVGDLPFGAVNTVSIKKLQEDAESGPGCQLTVPVQGMFCMGCAWLVEELAGRQPGVLSAKVALDSGRLSLAWEPGDFDLCRLAGELHRFGYRISGEPFSRMASMSPLAVRLCLTLVFSLNGGLLLLASAAGIGGPGLRQFYSLLLVVCLLFAHLLGGTLFLRPAWRGLLLRRWHSDAFPALILLGLLLAALFTVFMPHGGVLFAGAYFVVLPVMVLARWLSELRRLRIRA
ncbi:hypothetical protein DDZ13_10595 [Coraliomargarita sinensis]|uniref:Uncharacterized protein n=1 Tax=Coraliomargarita sinensis TaxID=2174842 RepID=A0A317ZEA0_9BACT|nr:heavy metal translocating P-type ATPase metal-binding domain-containing protein [Coraliomargarita sinensis]PXA03735.1 hypothetical protein DDZ13_10595 [Coraliomargarita sinensis]